MVQKKAPTDTTRALCNDPRPKLLVAMRTISISYENVRLTRGKCALFPTLYSAFARHYPARYPTMAKEQLAIARTVPQTQKAKGEKKPISFVLQDGFSHGGTRFRVTPAHTHTHTPTAQPQPCPKGWVCLGIRRSSRATVEPLSLSNRRAHTPSGPGVAKY